jgi:hypothetical protein
MESFTLHERPLMEYVINLCIVFDQKMIMLLVMVTFSSALISCQDN